MWPGWSLWGRILDSRAGAGPSRPALLGPGAGLTPCRAVTGIDLRPDAATTDKSAPGSITGDTLGTLVIHNVLITDPDVTPGPADTTWTPSPIVLAKCQSGETRIGGGVSVIG